MNGREWILCERTQRWAAALRHGLDRDPLPQPRPRLFETRSLRELRTRLKTRPDSLVLISVQRENFADVLACLADAVPRFPAARFAVLFDEPLALPTDERSKSPRQPRSDALHALAEAGASEFSASPRELRGIFALARKHAEFLRGRSIRPTDNRSLAAWAMSLLPWQDE